MKDASGMIRTGHFAVPAAQAPIFIDADDSIRSPIGCAGRANFEARRLVAMHAAHRQKNPYGAVGFQNTRIDHLSQAVGWDVVPLAADNRTGFAADAFAQINHHAPARRLIFQTNLSASSVHAEIQQRDAEISRFSGFYQFPNMIGQSQS
jgi:hypothetical protein